MSPPLATLNQSISLSAILIVFVKYYNKQVALLTCDEYKPVGVVFYIEHATTCHPETTK